MDQSNFEKLSVVANMQDIATKVIMLAAGDDFSIKPEPEVREDVATALNSMIRQGA